MKVHLKIYLRTTFAVVLKQSFVTRTSSITSIASSPGPVRRLDFSSMRFPDFLEKHHGYSSSFTVHYLVVLLTWCG